MEGDEDIRRTAAVAATLLVLALPSVPLFLVKLLALWLIAHGQRALGVTVILESRKSSAPRLSLVSSR